MMISDNLHADAADAEFNIDPLSTPSFLNDSPPDGGATFPIGEPPAAFSGGGGGGDGGGDSPVAAVFAAAELDGEYEHTGAASLSDLTPAAVPPAVRPSARPARPPPVWNPEATAAPSGNGAAGSPDQDQAAVEEGGDEGLRRENVRLRYENDQLRNDKEVLEQMLNQAMALFHAERQKHGPLLHAEQAKLFDKAVMEGWHKVEESLFGDDHAVYTAKVAGPQPRGTAAPAPAVAAPAAGGARGPAPISTSAVAGAGGGVGGGAGAAARSTSEASPVAAWFGSVATKFRGTVAQMPKKDCAQPRHATGGGGGGGGEETGGAGTGAGGAGGAAQELAPPASPTGARAGAGAGEASPDSGGALPWGSTSQDTTTSRPELV